MYAWQHYQTIIDVSSPCYISYHACLARSWLTEDKDALRRILKENVANHVSVSWNVPTYSNGQPDHSWWIVAVVYGADAVELALKPCTVVAAETTNHAYDGIDVIQTDKSALIARQIVTATCAVAQDAQLHMARFS